MDPYTFLPFAPGGAAPTRYEFESAEASVRLADTATIAVPLVHLRLIRVSGDDRLGFLHNLLSNDVLKLPRGRAQWNSLNSPKGRMIASLLMWHDDDAVMIALDADLHATVLKKLTMYVLRSKVRIEDATAATALVGVAGADAGSVLSAAGLALPAEDMSGTPETAPQVLRIAARMAIVLAPSADGARHWDALIAAGAHPAGTAAWDLVQIRAGLPRVTAATQEEFVAQMLNFELLGGVSFTKGCYPGQEIVARTQYLGKLKKRMYRLHATRAKALAPGIDVYAPEFGDQSAGKVVLAAPAPDGGWEMLAVVQSASAEAGELHLGSPAGDPATVLPLPYPLG